MPRIPDADLERLKQGISLAELCRSRGIELKPHGKKDLVGKCPFHKDKTPSFIVSPGKNLFHCMGCDAAGSVIDFVMKADGVDFRTAVNRLRREGPSTLAVPPPPPARQSMPPARLHLLQERVLALYEKTFQETPEGRAYFEKRGIGDAGLFITHRVGYANGCLLDLLPNDGRLKEELKAAGVLLANGKERFAGCVVFPVCDPDGTLTTIYARATDEDSKRRHLFLPDCPTGLWNASAMKTYSELILVESVMDALSVMMAGHRNVLAIQGTNGLGETDIHHLRTHGVQAITLLLDGDEAGKKAAARLLDKLAALFRCRVLTLPDGLDPNDFLQQYGAQALAAFLASGAQTPATTAPASTEEPGTVAADGMTVTYGLRRYELRGVEKGMRRLKATVRVEHAGRLHVDTVDFYAAKARRMLAMDLCRLFDEKPETIEGDIDKLLRHCEQLPEHQPAECKSATSPAERMTAAEKEEAETFGKSPTLCDDILADCETRGLIGERENALLLYVAMTSRKRDVPLSVLILSSSGAGKTAVQDAMLSFCPPEDLVKLTALSGKALFYKERLSLKHKVLALEEGDGAEDAMYAIRNLISSGELTSESTIKDLATGRLTTMENKVEGPCSVCFTTTKPDVDPETKSRFWVTSIDESRDQTRRILSFQRRQHLSDAPLHTPQVEAVLRRHRNFQRLLQPLAVKNPYAAQLAYGDDRLQGRRDQPKYLNLIKAIAFLRQMQKEILYERRNGVAVPYVKVEPADILTANHLAQEIMGRSLDELSRPGYELLLQLEMLADQQATKQDKENPSDKAAPGDILFSRRDVREFTGWSNTRLHVHLKELTDFEYLVVEAGRNGLPFRYRLAWEGQGKDGKRFLLELKQPHEVNQGR